MSYIAEHLPGFAITDEYSNVVRAVEDDGRSRRGLNGIITHGLLDWEAGVVAWALNAARAGASLSADGVAYREAERQ